MNMMERATTQVQQQDFYFASQHSIQDLCEIVAQKNFALVSSHKIASLYLRRRAPRRCQLRIHDDGQSGQRG